MLGSIMWQKEMDFGYQRTLLDPEISTRCAEVKSPGEVKF